MFNDKTNKSSLKTIADIKNLNNAFGYKQFVSTALAVSMLSGFALTAYSNINQLTPKVNAIGGCTEQSSALDNFDSPVQPNVNANNILGTSFNGWTMQNGALFNVVRVDGTNYNDGANSAHSGNQYIDVAGASDYPIKQFVLSTPGMITASAYFGNRFDPYNPHVSWNGQMEILDSSFNVIASGNSIPFTSSTPKNNWYKSEINNFSIPTAGTYYIRAFVGDYGHLDTVSYCLIGNPTLGTPVATTITPIVGVVGVSPFPTIILTGSNLPDNTVANFDLYVPDGESFTIIPILGKIIGGNFVPDAGQVVPANAILGPSTGILKSAGVADVTVPTNFTPVAPTATDNNYTANGNIPVVISPLMGDNGEAIKIKSIGGTVLTPAIAQTITVPSGAISIDTAGVISYVANPSFTGTATVPYIIEDSAGQTATANLIIAPTPPIVATNDNYTTESATPIILLPLTGDTAGSTLTSINGVVLTPVIQSIPVLGGNISASTTGDITFFANPGFSGDSTFPYVITAANGLTATANQKVTVTLPTAPTANNNTYTVVGSAPVTLTPLTGDTGTNISIKSINGVTLTPGTAQVISVTGGNVNVSATGDINFNANAGFTGDATFSYIIQDTSGQTATADQTITVSAPVVVSSSSVAASSSSIVSSSSTMVSYSSVVASSSVVVASSSTPAAPIATNDNYVATGSAPISLNPLAGDTAGSTIQSINGIMITPGVAQMISVTGGNVNVSATGVIQFVANAGFSGFAAFSYVIANAAGQTATADQIIAVSGAEVVSTPTNGGGVITIGSTPNYTTISSVSTLSSTSTSFQDTDGVSDNTESLAPNNGDANGDNIQDNLQSNVASLGDSVTGKYVSITVDPTSPCQTISNISVNTEEANGKDDINYDYPVGFVNFVSPCAKTIKVKMYWYGLDTTKSFVNRKFKANGSSYDLVSGITTAIETINGVPVLTYSYSVTDNDVLDEDPTIGMIKDPIGPAIVQIMTDSTSPTNTIRTGGNSTDLIIVLIFIMSIGFFSSILEKSKADK
jgi:Bacterial Ig domain